MSGSSGLSSEEEAQLDRRNALEIVETLRALLAERDQKIAELTGDYAGLDAEFEQQLDARERQAKKIATLESAAKEMQSTIEAQAREIEVQRDEIEVWKKVADDAQNIGSQLLRHNGEYRTETTTLRNANAALREEIAELIAELKKQKQG